MSASTMMMNSDNNDDFEMIDASTATSTTQGPENRQKLVNEIPAEIAKASSTLSRADDDESFSMVSMMQRADIQSVARPPDGEDDEMSFASWSHVNNTNNSDGRSHASSWSHVNNNHHEGGVSLAVGTTITLPAEAKPLACPKCHLISSASGDHGMVRCRACGYGSEGDTRFTGPSLRLALKSATGSPVVAQSPDEELARQLQMIENDGAMGHDNDGQPFHLSEEEEIARQLQAQEEVENSEQRPVLAQMILAEQMQLQEVSDRACPHCTVVNPAKNVLCECCGSHLYENTELQPQQLQQRENRQLLQPLYNSQLVMSCGDNNCDAGRRRCLLDSVTALVLQLQDMTRSPIFACDENWGLVAPFLRHADSMGQGNLVLVYHFGSRDPIAIQRKGLHKPAIVSRNMEAAYNNPGTEYCPYPGTNKKMKNHLQNAFGKLNRIDEEEDGPTTSTQKQYGWIVATMESPDGGPVGRAVHVSSLSATVYRIAHKAASLPLVYFDPEVREHDVIRQLLNGLYQICNDCLKQKQHSPVPVQVPCAWLSLDENRQTTKGGLDMSRCIGTKPGEMDAVLGRGCATNHHEGNRLFRALVDARKQDFARATTNRKRADVVRGCIAHHEARGGRIVGMWNGKYYEVTEDRKYNKVIQCLRKGQMYNRVIQRVGIGASAAALMTS